MVFDNCQIDVFFHMRSHYNRLRNVRSVVDCSTPKGFHRFAHSDTGCQYVAMTHPSTKSFGMKKHNCCYGHCPFKIKKKSPRTKSPPSRPSTRRHSQEMPSTSEGYSDLQTETSLNSGNSKRSSLKRRNRETKNNPNDNSDNNNTPQDVPESPPTYNKNLPKDTQPPKSGLNPNENQKLKESTKYKTPVVPKEEKKPIDKIEDHEYLQFLLRITEDIIKNDLYTNKGIKKVFISHIKANKDRLNLDRMLLHIYELMRELSVSFSDDPEVESVPSWKNIEAAMKGLICIKKNEKEVSSSPDISQKNYRKTPESGRNCICSNLKTLDQCFPIKKQIIEDFQSHIDDSVNKLQYSLDRLTECTEPMSSQATCKVSSTTACSSFGNVEVLPGFENLETPTCSKNLMQKELCPQKCIKRSNASIRRSSSLSEQIKKFKPVKSKPPKFPSRRNSREIKRIASTSTEDLELEKPAKFEIPNTRKSADPILISLREKRNENESKVLNIRSSGHNYVLVPGLTYILKEFIDDNPNALTTIEIPYSLPIASNTPNKEEVFANDQEDNTEGKIEEFVDVSEDRIENIDENKSSYSMIDHQEIDEVKEMIVRMLSKPFMEEQSFSELFEEPPSDLNLDDQKKIDISSPKQSEQPESDKILVNQSNHSQNDTTLPIETPHPEDFEKNLLTNEYDLTPQKDNDFKASATMNGLMGDDYSIPILNIDNKNPQIVMNMKEIKNEDEKILTSNSSINNSKNLSEESSALKKVRENNSATDKDDISAEEELNSPLNFSAEESRQSNSSEKLDENITEEPEKPIPEKKNSKDNNSERTGNLSDIVSIATIEKTNQVLDDIEEKIPIELAVPLYQEFKFRKDRLGSEDESEVKEIIHQRKVSILKNPINVPIEKIFGEIDDTKKKGESIKRAVENLKDRQANRDHFIPRPIQEMENSRMSEKAMANIEIPAPSPIIHSSLKSRSKGQKSDEPKSAKLASTDEWKIEDVMATIGNSSIEKLSLKLSSTKPDAADAFESINTGTSDEAAFLPEFDEKPDQVLSPTQLRHMTMIKENVDNFNHGYEKKDEELTIMLDQLVDAFKKQQEMEDEVKREDEDHREVVVEEPEIPPSFRCCGLCKKKRVPQVKPFREPVTMNSANISEETYKAKSEAFETALASLGQKNTTEQAEPKTNETTSTVKEPINPSPILHSGNRLSLVRIADEKESNDYTLENSESDITINKDEKNKK